MNCTECVPNTCSRGGSRVRGRSVAAMSTITTERLREVVAAIPPGGWMSYGDVAAACGGNDRHARTLNGRFLREEIPAPTAS